MIIVERYESPLKRQVWYFTQHGERIVLSSYLIEERPSKRHRMTVSAIAQRSDRFLERLYQRGNTMLLSAVPLPDDVAAEAKQQVVDRLQVVKG